MRGLWRYIVLMFAPALLWGGFFINGWWRLWDVCYEPLLVFAGVLAAGGVVFAVNARLARRLPCASPCIATVDWIVSGLLLIVPGVIQHWGLPGHWMGAAEIWIALGGSAWVLHSWPELSGSDRNWRAVGLLAATVVYAYFIKMYRTHFLEALFFWGGELLLFLLLLASPATCRGANKSRWRQRGCIAAVFLLASIVRPDYLYAPWRERPACMPPDAVWAGTDVSPGGSYFNWKVPYEKEKEVLFDARGRLVKLGYPDADMIPAIPGLLGVGGVATPDVLVAAGDQTVWITALCNSGPDVRVHWLATPPIMGQSMKDMPPQATIISVGAIASCKPFSMLVVLAVPEYPAFEGGLLRWLGQITSHLQKNAVVAVPSRLLESPTLMRYFLEHYTWHGVVPGSGGMWVFSDFPRDLSPAAIDQALEELFGEDAPLPRGVYELMCTKLHAPQPETSGPVLHLSAEYWHSLRTGKRWWNWVGYGVLALLLWRLVRLFAERRGAGYRYWNLLENSFSVTASYFAWMSFYISEYGVIPAYVFTCALIPAAMLISYWKSYLSWAILAVTLWYCWRQGAGINGDMWLLLFAVNAWIGSCYAMETLPNPAQFRHELPAWGIGMAIAALAIGVCIGLEAPIKAVAVLLIVARLPIFWQMKCFSWKR